MSYDKDKDYRDVNAAIAAGMALGDVKAINEGLSIIVLPEGAKAHEIDLEKYQTNPNRKQGVTNLDDVASFIAFVNRQKTGVTELFAKVSPPSFVAVFNSNDAANGDAGWSDFRAGYACPLSDEWKTWTGKDGVHQAQDAFARFIEDNLPDVVSPEGAVMLEVSRGLEAKSSVNFASAIRLADGSQQFSYKEEVQGTTQDGKMNVPAAFQIGIPVFQGDARWPINARLRYRINGGKLVMWYDLERPSKVLELAFAEARAKIQAETGLTALLGTHPSR